MPSREVPADHPARPALRAALWTSLLNAAVFTVFAYVTAHAKPVRHISPWQDDPYDTVATFTMFFVPMVTLLIAMRMTLCRRDQALPLHRATQLLRAALVSAGLATATYATDYVAVIARADRSTWNARTSWLIAALALASVLAAANWAMLARTRGKLPRRPDGGDQAAGDWLDDALPVIEIVAARLPRPAGRFAAWLERRDAAAWIRRRFTPVVMLMSLFAGVTAAAAQVREDGFGPLFFSETAWFAGGMYAFCMISNEVLQLTVRQPRGRSRQAAHVSIIAAAAALPVSLGLRSSILAVPALSGVRGTTGSVTALTFTCAVLAGAIVFAVMALRPSRTRS